MVEANYPRLCAKHPSLFKSHGFNPVAALDPASPRFVDDAKALAVALIKTDDSRDKYWSQAVQALVKGLIMGLRLAFGEKASLARLRLLLGEPPAKLAETNAKLIQAFGQKCPAIAASLGEFATYSPNDDKELGAVRRTAKVQTDWLDSPRMQADLSGGTYDFALLKHLATTIYLVLPPEFLATHGVWLRLMVTSILLPLLRSVERAPVPVLFMLDEFAQLGHMEVIENNYALMRGFGVKLWVIFQDLTQAKNLYNDRWESFVSNAGMVQTFAPQDLTMREYLSKLSGERINWQEKTSHSTNYSKGGIGGGESTSRTNWPRCKRMKGCCSQGTACGIWR